jgi:hypothetical protein
MSFLSPHPEIFGESVPIRGQHFVTLYPPMEDLVQIMSVYFHFALLARAIAIWMNVGLIANIFRIHC